MKGSPYSPPSLAQTRLTLSSNSLQINTHDGFEADSVSPATRSAPLMQQIQSHRRMSLDGLDFKQPKKKALDRIMSLLVSESDSDAKSEIEWERKINESSFLDLPLVSPGEVRSRGIFRT